MDIEAPKSVSEPFEWIWRLPFKIRETNAWIKEFNSSAPDAEHAPQTNFYSIKMKYHYRYQSPAEGKDYTETRQENPEVFIDCRNAHIRLFAKKYDNPIINQINESNAPEPIIQLMPNARLEFRDRTIIVTVITTIAMTIVAQYSMWSTFFNLKIRVD
mmetsp:Transcript_15830/g.11176  ORF Transcript_15830/g.11176 Transcript_15830/m.11176 type:complete len:158 (+) Transcript_15830:275-748(+)